MQERLEVNKKSLNQFKNRLMQIRRIQEQRTNLSKAKKIYLKISKYIFKNKAYKKKAYQKKDDLLNALVNIKCCKYQCLYMIFYWFLISLNQIF